jgi:hypothetical protein
MRLEIGWQKKAEIGVRQTGRTDFDDFSLSAPKDIIVFNNLIFLRVVCKRLFLIVSDT